MTLHEQIKIHSSGRPQPTCYPPPPDARYGELVRLRNRARKLGETEVLADLQWRLDHFFQPAAQAQMELAI